MQEKVDKLLKEMSIAEKALMCCGRDFWYTRGVKRFGLEPYMVTDGPHGLRKQSQSADNLGINDSVKATCFPTACAMASSWDKELIFGMGKRMGEEAKDERVSVILGPGVNIKRSPLCGRNFEYYSEDPYLAGKCAASLINGIQSNGIGTSIKHFAVNSQEADRLRVSAVIDERTLREIYLEAFRIAVIDSQPATVMCSYNRINGVYASNNKKILSDILRDEWGFKGYVMTDWGAVDDVVSCIKNGMDLEMPGGSGESVYKIINAVEDGSLKIEELDRAVRRLIEFNLKATEARDFTYVYDREEHHNYAHKAATESAVLLKNEGVLPLNAGDGLLVFGGLAKTPRYQGSGSSLIKPNKLVSFLEALDAEKIDYKYEEGFSAVSDKIDDISIENALNLAKNSTQKTVVVCAGLTMFYESEGFDRDHMKLPPNQNALIEKLVAAGKDVVVLLFGGSPVEMPWISGVKALLNMYLAGQAVGEAVTDLIFGRVNPSGKLAETFPLSLEDTPSFKYYPEGPVTVEYREGLFVGYRYYASAKKKVLFPFGFGLSYTTFEYSDLIIAREENGVNLSFKVKNTGARKGKEITEVYVGAPETSRIVRPVIGLKAFEKVELEAGEEKTVELIIGVDAFRYFNTAEGKWCIENNEYPILIGASSEDIRLRGSVDIGSDGYKNPYESAIFDEYRPYNGKASDEAFSALLGFPIPSKARRNDVVTMDSSMEDIRIGWFGKFFYWAAMKAVAPSKKKQDENAVVMANFMRRMMQTMTLRSIANTNGGILSQSCVDGLILAINHHFFRGIGGLLKAIIKNHKQDKSIKELEILERKVK